MADGAEQQFGVAVAKGGVRAGAAHRPASVAHLNHEERRAAGLQRAIADEGVDGRVAQIAQPAAVDGGAGKRRTVMAVTMARLPQPPRKPQKRSGFSS